MSEEYLEIIRQKTFVDGARSRTLVNQAILRMQIATKEGRRVDSEDAQRLLDAYGSSREYLALVKLYIDLTNDPATRYSYNKELEGLGSFEQALIELIVRK